MDVVEFGELDDERAAELEGDEAEPFGPPVYELRWRNKDQHVALQDHDGRLVACAGLVVAEIQLADDAIVPVVGVGGVIVAAPHRGKGLADRVIAEALRRAETLGPSLAMLFCHRHLAGLYRRHQFVEIPAPVFVEQPSGLVEIPMVAMWRTIRSGAELPSGPVMLRGLPF